MRQSTRYAGIWSVFAGGMVGTTLRYLIGQTVGRNSGPSFFALDTFIVNIVGAFALALIVGFITGSGTLTRAKLRFRLFFGTGLLGGFTTYSTFALQTAGALRDNNWVLVAAYGVGTLTAGLLASLVGLLIGRVWSRNVGELPLRGHQRKEGE